MKTKNYLRKSLIYAFAVIFTAFIFLAVLVKAVASHEAIWWLAFWFTSYVLGGNIALLVNYLKKDSKAWPSFSITVWLVSGVPLSVSITYALTDGATTFLTICIIALAILFALNGFVYSSEENKKTDLFIAKMRKDTDERIAEMKRQSAAFIAEMRKSTDESIANMRK